MRFLKPGFYIDFMRARHVTFAVSGLLVALSLLAAFYPGPNYGIDFAGGTELQVGFKGSMTSARLRSLLREEGYDSPEVIQVQDTSNEFIIRVQEISALGDADVSKLRSALKNGLQSPLRSFKVSPGGDKVSLQFSSATEPETIEQALEASGTRVRGVAPFGQSSEHRYEVQLYGVADELVEKLEKKLGAAGPEAPRRVEWVGPKAGQQLRDAALKSFLYAIAFIMFYVALRFDLRFAPGGVLAMVHDGIITLGIFILLQREINLTLVAALLTIMGYSINDTIVVYDRIRENLARRREAGLREVINISTSETLSRTLITGGTTLLSFLAFFIWGTPIIRDFALALLIGVVVGTYSSIFIAAPLTEWVDRRFFHRGAKV